MIKRAVFFLSLVLGGTSTFAMSMTMYAKVMNAVNTRDLKALQQIVAGGVDLNSPQLNGMTPLCETVMRRDYQGYEMLVSQGASPYVACIRRMSQEEVADFYAGQPKPNTYYVGRMMGAHAAGSFGEGLAFPFPILSVGEVLLGGVAAGAILTLGHGGGSSGGGGSGNNYKWDAPLNLDPKDFAETAEYRSSNVYGDGEVEGRNFLGAINAANAYARGYTGYYVNREADGTLRGEGESAISSRKVRIGVVDDGVYTDQDDLKRNVNKKYSYVYGVCGETDTSRCWQWEASDGGKVGKARLYKDWTFDPETGIGTGTATEEVTAEMSKEKWDVYEYRYKGYYETLGRKPRAYSVNDVDPIIYEKWLGTYEDAEGEKKKVVLSVGAEIGGDSSSSDDSGDESATTLGMNITWYAYDENYNRFPVVVTETEEAVTYSTTIEIDGQEVDVALEKVYTADTHGTEVAGVAAAVNTGKQEDPPEYGSDSGMMGVAYDAEIIPVKIDYDMNTLDGVKQAVMNSDIVNLSLQTGLKDDGISYSDTSEMVKGFDKLVESKPHLMAGYRAAASSNVIMVFSAGNYTSGTGTYPFDSSLYSVAPLSDYFNGKKKDEYGDTYNLKDLFVNVVAVNSMNKLASYSAKCGATKDFCVAAPGGDSDSYIYSTSFDIIEGGEGEGPSTFYNSTYAPVQGTSFATPAVAGALAVIKGAFPHLTSQQVVQILFETAKDLGTPGVDEIYGHGLVDLDAATSPIGLPKIPLKGSTKVAVENANSSSSTVPASFAGVADALPARMIVLDKYQRAFQMPTKSFVRVAKRENKLEGHFKSFMSGNEKVVANTDSFKMAYSDRHSRLNSQMKQGSVRFELKPTPKWQFKSFYTENTETSGGTYFERLMMSPYGKMKEAWGSVVSYDLTKNWRASVMGQVGKNGFMNEDDLRRSKHNKVSLFQSTLQYNGLKRVGLKVTAGVANEQGSMLGMWGRGAFKSGNSHTNFVGAGITLNLTDALKLEGMYYKGTTKVDNTNSLIRMSEVKSDSFALTAAWQMNEDRMLGLQFASPLRVTNGVATVNLPTSRDAYQDIVYQDEVRASLKPSAREYDIGLYYTDALKEDMHFQSELGVRLNPDHVAGAAPDWRALVGLKLGL